MTEWTVVTVIVVLAGLIATIIKPIIKLNGTLTRLGESVDALEKNISGLTSRNSETHEKLWGKLEAQERALGGHETRIQILERKK